MSYQAIQENRLLLFASTTGEGTEYIAERCKGWNFIFNANSVTSGATIDIEVEYGDDLWVPIHTETITATGVTIAQSENGVFKKLRANITSYTDGLYNVYAQGCLGN